MGVEWRALQDIIATSRVQQVAESCMLLWSPGSSDFDFYGSWKSVMGFGTS
jgi:hypothetical protein